MNDKHYFIVDFFCHEHKVIIELDGPIHKYQIDYDSARESILKDMGYTIIRFDNEVIFRNWEYVENEVMRVCGLKYVIY